MTSNRVFFVPGAAGREKLAHMRLFTGSPTLRFEIIRTGNWREWIKQDFSFDDLVARARSQILAAGEHPPLRLAGSSQGGLLAYATALSLGDKAGFLGLLDTNADVSLGHPPKLGGVLNHALRFLLHGNHGKGQTIKRVFWTLWRQCRTPAQRQTLLNVIARWHRPFRTSGAVILDWEIQMAVFAELWNAWVTPNRSLSTPAFLFRSNEPGSPDLGWKALCSNLTIVPVTGGHLSMLEEKYVRKLAEQFAAVLLP